MDLAGKVGRYRPSKVCGTWQLCETDTGQGILVRFSENLVLYGSFRTSHLWVSPWARAFAGRGDEGKQDFQGSLLLANHDIQHCGGAHMAFFAGRGFWRGKLSSHPLVFSLTQGGPAGATRFMVQMIQVTGFEKSQMGYACAMTTVLFVVLSLFTSIQFRVNKGGGQDGE